MGTGGQQTISVVATRITGEEQGWITRGQCRLIESLVKPFSKPRDSAVKGSRERLGSHKTGGAMSIGG